MKRLLTLLMVTCALAPTAAQAQWGDLKMKFVLDGTAEPAAALAITKDPQFCGKHNLKDEAVVIDRKTKGISNVVVFLYVGLGGAQPAIHASYKEEADMKIQIDNKNCRYQPRILTMMTSQTLLITNPDPVGHNTKIDTFNPANPAQNFNLPAGAQVEHKFTVAESLPTPVSCSIHPWMKSYILIKDNPYMGVSDAQGNITIKNVPVGKLRFRVWQEKAGYVSKVSGLDIDKKGRFDIDVKAGANDLGTIKVSAEEFAD